MITAQATFNVYLDLHIVLINANTVIVTDFSTVTLQLFVFLIQNCCGTNILITFLICQNVLMTYSLLNLGGILDEKKSNAGLHFDAY